MDVLGYTLSEREEEKETRKGRHIVMDLLLGYHASSDCDSISHTTPRPCVHRQPTVPLQIPMPPAPPPHTLSAQLGGNLRSFPGSLSNKLPPQGSKLMTSPAPPRALELPKVWRSNPKGEPRILGV